MKNHRRKLRFATFPLYIIVNSLDPCRVGRQTRSGAIYLQWKSFSERLSLHFLMHVFLFVWSVKKPKKRPGKKRRSICNNVRNAIQERFKLTNGRNEQAKFHTETQSSFQERQKKCEVFEKSTNHRPNQFESSPFKRCSTRCLQANKSAL